MKQNIGKKREWGRKWTAVAVILAVVMIFAISTGNLGYGDALTDEEVRSYLESIGAADAVYVDNAPGLDLPDGTPSSKRYDIYHSDVTGYDYYFHSNSGLLWKVYDPDGLDKDVEVVSDEVWKQRVLESVSLYLGDRQIGELEFESANVTGDWCTTRVVEKYQGMETGTRVYVRCLRDGTPITCQLRYGSVFSEVPGGAVSVQNVQGLLGEEVACTMALEAMEEHLDGMTVQSTSCELKAVEDTQYYQVTLTVQTEPYIIEFRARLDSHSGELLSWDRSL